MSADREATHTGGQELISSPKPFEAVLSAIREIDFGTVEVVIHQGQIREIRQIRRKRFDPAGTSQK